MRALVLDQGKLRLDASAKEPPMTEGDTLIKVLSAGICATDLELAAGYMSFSGIPGHEFCGLVQDSSQKDLIGKRVVGEINVVCGRCDLCLTGLSTHCRNRTVLGILKHNGAFADFLRLPATNLHVLPPEVDDEQAVFVEPLAAAYEVLRQVKIDSRTWVTVLGDGRLGLLMAQVLRNAGAPVRVIGKHPAKLALCEKWQIRSRPMADIVPRHDQDVVIDCTGSAAGLQVAIAMTRPRGTLVLKSTYKPTPPPSHSATGTGVATGAIDLSPVVVDEITIVGSRCGPFSPAIAALKDRSVDVHSLIHKRYKLPQALEAFDHAAKPGVLKVILKMD